MRKLLHPRLTYSNSVLDNSGFLLALYINVELTQLHA
jgi:hypothetical protein